MASPFPGMDPYLEDPDIWPGFHTTLYVEMMGDLNKVLPPGYLAKIDRHVWLHEPEARNRVVSGGKMLSPFEREGSLSLRILAMPGRQVVSVIQILTHRDKTQGSDREAFVRAKDEYLRGGKNYVEFDFLRSGTRDAIVQK